MNADKRGLKPDKTGKAPEYERRAGARIASGIGRHPRNKQLAFRARLSATGVLLVLILLLGCGLWLWNK